ncbi:unnamed protein product [Eruca vesicaria subsp. sativa]|uniref:Uncharacterized protein n=1 Tax=Eruca vesicaria subsp. sativa TaxID=29727 RepID=A0ABC8IZM9_ERUVS|nr:unnamed protein product [Eruca vesicaria subsp. sativa]
MIHIVSLPLVRSWLRSVTEPFIPGGGGRQDHRISSYKGIGINGNVENKEQGNGKRHYQGNGKKKMYDEREAKLSRVEVMGPRGYVERRSREKYAPGNSYHQSHSQGDSHLVRNGREREEHPRDSNRDKHNFGNHRELIYKEKDTHSHSVVHNERSDSKQQGNVLDDMVKEEIVSIAVEDGLDLINEVLDDDILETYAMKLGSEEGGEGTEDDLAFMKELKDNEALMEEDHGLIDNAD